MVERIAKERLNIILLVDASQSMQGKRIKQVNQAILDIKDYLKELQVENTNVDFFITIIPFATEASFYKDTKYINIDNFDYEGIKIGGYSNLHLGYELLGDILKKESKGGIMPDFGGVAPIILLLTDGHPTGKMYKEYLERISTSPWFKAALRYGIAIELDDEKTLKVLNDFVGGNGEVVSCYNANMLQRIIKIIVLTASKVKSSASKVVSVEHVTTKDQEIIQEIGEKLADIESWEW